MTHEIKTVTVPTEAPSANSLGAVEVGYYFVEGRDLTMTDAEGIQGRSAAALV